MCKHAEDDCNEPKYSMPLEYMEKIVSECKELEIPSINIGSGTECTLHPQFKEIALKIKDSGAIDKFFLTNGTTLTDDMTIYEAWHSPKMQKLRKGFVTGELMPHCRECLLSIYGV